MLKAKKLFWVSLLFSVFTNSYSLSLGDMEVNSYLNQPLVAQVSIEQISNIPTANILIQVAPNEAYKKLGLVPPAQLPPLHFKILKSINNQYFIQITTTGPVNSPIFEFLLEVNSQRQQTYRNYAVLLNPAPIRTQPTSNSKLIINPAKNQSVSQPLINKTRKINLPNLSTQSVAQQAIAKTSENSLPNVIENGANLPTNHAVPVANLKLNTSSGTPRSNDNLVSNNNPLTSADKQPLEKFTINSLSALENKLANANNLIINLQQKNDSLTMKLDDLQGQVFLLKNQLQKREQTITNMETNLSRYQSITSQLDQLKIQINQNNKKSSSSFWQVFVSLLAILSLGSLGYLYWRNKTSFASLSIHEILNNFLKPRPDDIFTATSETTASTTVDTSHSVTTTTDINALEHSDIESAPPNYSTFENPNNIDTDNIDTELTNSPHDTLNSVTNMTINSNYKPIHTNSDILNSLNNNVEDSEAQTIDTNIIEFESLSDNKEHNSDNKENSNDNDLNHFEKTLDTNSTDKVKSPSHNLVDEKIDLAIAYLEFHDKHSAESLLEEVLQEGNDIQKNRAQELLNKIR